MRELLLSKIKPLEEVFIEGLLKIQDEIKDKEKALEARIHDKGKEIKSLQDQKIEHDKALKTKTDVLTVEVSKTRQFQENLRTEVSKYTRLNNDLDKEQEKAERLTKQRELEESLTRKELDKQKEKTEVWQKKIDLLQIDAKKNDEKRQELIARERQVEIKEKINFRHEEKNIAESQRLSKLDLDIRYRLKNAELAEKRAKING